MDFELLALLLEARMGGNIEPRKYKPAGSTKMIISPSQVYMTNFKYQARNSDNEHLSLPDNSKESAERAHEWAFGKEHGKIPLSTDIKPDEDYFHMHTLVKNKEFHDNWLKTHKPEGDLKAPEGAPESVIDKHLRHKKGRLINKTNQIYHNEDGYQKDKTLANINTGQTEAFKRGLETDIETFNKKSEGNFLSSQKFSFEPSVYEAANQGLFPKRYVDLLERVANVRETKDTTSWKYFTEQELGQGTVASVFGEILTMMACTMDDKDSYQMCKHMYDAMKSSYEKGHSETGTGKQSVLGSWVGTALQHRTGIMADLKAKFGEDFHIVNGCLNVNDEVQAMGFRSKADVGKSTDIIFKVQDSQGTEHAVEYSLKKSLKDRIMTKPITALKKWDETLSDELDSRKFEGTRHKKLVEKGQEYMQQVDAILGTGSDLAHKVRKFMDIAGAKTYSDLFSLRPTRKTAQALFTGILATGMVGNKGAMEFITGLRKESREFSNKIIGAISTNDKLSKHLLEEIREQFPIRSIASGEETLIAGSGTGNSHGSPNILNQETLNDIFGTSDYKVISDRLYAFPSRNKQKAYIGYRAGPEDKAVSIAVINIRETGLGWKGSFDMAMNFTPEFQKRIDDASKQKFGHLTGPSLDEVSS